MCGRYYINAEDDEIKKIINILSKEYDNYRSGEIFPSDIAPIYIVRDNKLKLIQARWGLPRQHKKGTVINARIETLTQKPSFKYLVRTNRCIVPASGFFEWKKDGISGKITDKYMFRKNDSLLFMAGLYSRESGGKNKQLSLFSPENDEAYYFTIVTKEADSTISPIHDRMPLIFGRKEASLWLKGIDIDELLKNNNASLISETV